MHHNPNPVNKLGLLKVGTVVQLKKTGEYAIIADVVCLMDRQENFLHYMGIIEGRGEGMYALYDADLDFEGLPNEETLKIVEQHKRR